MSLCITCTCISCRFVLLTVLVILHWTFQYHTICKVTKVENMTLNVLLPLSNLTFVKVEISISIPFFKCVNAAILSYFVFRMAVWYVTYPGGPGHFTQLDLQ